MAAWEQVTETQWALTDDDGGILAAVHVGHSPTGRDTYRTAGPMMDRLLDFATLADAQRAVERFVREDRSRLAADVSQTGVPLPPTVDDP